MAGAAAFTVDADGLLFRAGPDLPTIPPAPKYASTPSRIPVFSTLYRLARRPTSQENESRKPTGETTLKRQYSDTSQSIPSSASSGSVTPRSDSPDTLDLTPFGASTPTSYNADAFNSSFAELSIRLWMMAKDPTQYQDPHRRAQARTMQIDAVRYMHMSLPSDLTPMEASAIRSSLPREVLSDRIPAYNRAKPTVLRRVVAQTVALLLALVIFFVPLLTSILNATLKYEREHRMTERLLVRAQHSVSNLGAYRAQVQSTLLHFLDSPAGRRVIKSGSYVVEGVAGGVVDGYCGYQDARVVSRRTPSMGTDLTVSCCPR